MKWSRHKFQLRSSTNHQDGSHNSSHRSCLQLLGEIKHNANLPLQYLGPTQPGPWCGGVCCTPEAHRVGIMFSASCCSRCVEPFAPPDRSGGTRRGFMASRAVFFHYRRHRRRRLFFRGSVGKMWSAACWPPLAGASMRSSGMCCDYTL